MPMSSWRAVQCNKLVHFVGFLGYMAATGGKMTLSEYSPGGRFGQHVDLIKVGRVTIHRPPSQ
jgi:hypothetical protein